MKYNLLCFQISDRLIIFLNKHDYQVLTSLMKQNKKYKRLKTAKWISIRKLVPGLLLTVRSAGRWALFWTGWIFIPSLKFLSKLAILSHPNALSVYPLTRGLQLQVINKCVELNNLCECVVFDFYYLCLWKQRLKNNALRIRIGKENRRSVRYQKQNSCLV